MRKRAIEQIQIAPEKKMSVNTKSVRMIYRGRSFRWCMLGVLFIGLFCFSGFELLSQEQERPQPPPRETEIQDPERIERQEIPQERLPEFELPEYIITGRATFRMPYVQKQRITERNVFVAEIPETMKEKNREIDTTPIDVPTKSFGEFEARPVSQHGQVRLGYGRFNTPALSGWAHFRTGPWGFGSQVDYHSTEGYRDFAEGMDLDARFRVGHRFQQSAPAFIRGAEPYLSFGFETVTHHIVPANILVTSLRDREFRTAFTDLGFRSGSDAPLDFDLLFGLRGSTLEDKSRVFDLKEYTNDDELYAGLKTLGYLRSTRAILDISYKVNKLDREIQGDDTQYFRGMARLLFPFMDNRASFEIGGGLYSTQSGDEDTETMLKPFAEVRYMPVDALTFYATYAPVVQHRSLYLFRKANPFLSRNVPVRFSDELVNAMAGAEYMPTRALQVNSFLQYQEIDDYPVWLFVPNEGTFSVDYEGTTTIASLNTDVRYAPSDRDLLTTRITLRYTNNSEYEKSVPFLSPIEIALMYTHDFPIGIRASIGGELIGSRRYGYREDDGDLDAFLNVYLDVQYQFHNIMGVYMKLDNILNQKYEQYYRYPARPFYIEGGIQLSF